MRSVEMHESFKLKKDHHVVLAEVRDIRGLREAIREAPDEAVLFHLDGRNDYAAWIGNVLGSRVLQEEVLKVDPRMGAKKAREELVDTLGIGIKLLKEIERAETALIY